LAFRIGHPRTKPIEEEIAEAFAARNAAVAAARLAEISRE
jgi:hypothetical protein